MLNDGMCSKGAVPSVTIAMGWLCYFINLAIGQTDMLLLPDANVPEYC
jgi:hypothetical protein